MATTKTIQPTGETINLPEMTDRPDMSVVSTSLGKVVDAVNSDNASLIKTEEALAIISTGNTHGAINAGQYVYVRAHSTLAEGLYLASANVAANGTLSGSNVTAVSGGGLNALNSNLEKVVATSGTANARNLSTYTGKTLIDECVTNGYKLYYCSASGGNKVSDMPIIQAGIYIVFADSYYKAMHFYGTDGAACHFDYNANTWTSTSAKLNVTFTPAEHVTVSSDAINCYTHNGCLFFNMRISTDSSFNSNTVGTFSGVQALNTPAYNYISCGLYDSTPANVTARVGGGTNPVLQIFKNAGIPASCDVWVSGVIRLVGN